MKEHVLLALLLLLNAAPLAGQTRSCAGTVSLHDFRLLVASSKAPQTMTLAAVNDLKAGDRLLYRPAKAPADPESKARIAVIFVPALDEPSAELTVLDARSAYQPGEWNVPFRPAIVAVVFGPQGLDVKKVSSLVDGKEMLISQMADYAEQTARVGALVEALTTWEQSSSRQNNLNAILSGFSSQYGVAVPKLNPSSPADQQAALLLRALLPPLSSYDPLAAQPSARVQQSAGLAATVASLFFGSPVALAAGGTALFQNLRSLMFPDTDFRSAFTQAKGPEEVALCSEPRAGKSRTRVAYLWAHRLPASGPPSLTLGGELHVPSGWKTTLKVSAQDPAQLRLVSRVQGWSLVPVDGGNGCPVAVAAGANPGELVLDPGPAIAPGAYRLGGKWDWDSFELPGTVNVHEFGKLTSARIQPDSEDRLIEGAGPVSIRLDGTDFEFVDRVSLLKTDRLGATPIELPFALPVGRSAGPQDNLETQIDTKSTAAGTYRLRLTQLNRQSHDLAVTIHPPVPKLEGTPVRVNVGESSQTVRLRGVGLDRIEQISGDAMEWELGPVADTAGRPLSGERQATVRLSATAAIGDRPAIRLKIRGMHQPVVVPAALEFAGPRPRILAFEKSLATAPAVALREDEIPAGEAASFAVRTEFVDATAVLELNCGPVGAAPAKLSLHPGEARENAKLDFAGEGVLYLSLDPRALGAAPCELMAAVRTDTSGRSDPVRLGRILAVPQIERLELSDEKAAGNLYVATLVGRDLQAIERTGWDAHAGHAVIGMPKPEPGQPQIQRLRIALPWPSPSPRAPIFVWLRGETDGRATRVTF